MPTQMMPNNTAPAATASREAERIEAHRTRWTAEAHSVREFCGAAFGHVGLDYQEHVVVDPRYFRPAEVDHLRSDANETRRELGWAPHTSFTELVQMMVDANRAGVG